MMHRLDGHIAYRLLVTGGRHRTDTDTIHQHLDEAAKLAADRGATELVIVHGDCPTGADPIADRWAWRNTAPIPVVPDPHPADWNRHGNGAGMIRNAAMVALGADECLAYPDPDSTGTYRCVGLARKAGIDTTIHRLPDDPPKRIQRRRIRGWRLPAAAVSVCRPSKWGSPYPIADDDPAARAASVRSYRRYLLTRPDLIADAQRELQGRDVACYCRVGEPCHGNSLLAVAAGGQP